MDIELEANERIDDLEFKNLKIIQNKDGFCFGIDSVLLSDFAKNIKKDSMVLDLGTGTGSSVLEVINAFEKVSNQKLNYQIVGRREGDVIEAYANTDKANTVLGWKAQSTLEEALASAWKWENKIRNK